MVAAVNPPRGMRDFLPTEKARRERVLAVIRDRYRAHGFDEIETPVVEDSARLHSGIGGDNEKLAFNILKRGLSAEDVVAAADDQSALSDLGLRYDLTVPLARFYATHRAALPTVFRSIQIAPVWRAERPQKGRYRQFIQCDIDVIGDASYRAEAELLTATLDALDALGLTGIAVRINDRRILDALLEHFGFAHEQRPGVLITIDKLDKIGPAGVAAELRERGADDAAVTAFEAYLTELVPAEQFDAESIAAALPAGVGEAGVQNLLQIAAAVGAARSGEAPFVFDPFLVRGMGYYTGTIFELADPRVGFSVGGGGRYDGMIGRFLGQDVPAVGSSLGFERIVDLLDEEDDETVDALVLVHDRDVPVHQLVAVKAQLVAAGTRVRLEQRPKNLKALLERAALDGYTSFAIVSADTADIDHLERKPLH